jgi:hypothetical protein
MEKAAGTDEIVNAWLNRLRMAPNSLTERARGSPRTMGRRATDSFILQLLDS